MTLAELAADLSLTKARVSQLVQEGLVVVRNGRVDRRKTLELLRLYWVPASGWHDKPVGPFGQALRRKWQAEEAAEQL
jgi:hypothetical protein